MRPAVTTIEQFSPLFSSIMSLVLLQFDHTLALTHTLIVAYNTLIEYDDAIKLQKDHAVFLV